MPSSSYSTETLTVTSPHWPAFGMSYNKAGSSTAGRFQDDVAGGGLPNLPQSPLGYMIHCYTLWFVDSEASAGLTASELRRMTTNDSVRVEFESTRCPSLGDRRATTRALALNPDLRY